MRLSIQSSIVELYKLCHSLGINRFNTISDDSKDNIIRMDKIVNF